MIRQRKTSTNIGKDTHVRPYNENFFKEQSSESFQTVIGEISITEPEPLFRQNMVTVELARGGTISSVAYPGAFIDPTTGYLHGTYEGPIPGQMVTIGFENGNMNAPMVVNRYPYQGKGDTIHETAYLTPLTTASYDATDVMIGHFSGSELSFNTGILSGKLPGSVTLNAVTDFDVYSGSNVTFDATLDFNVSSNANILLESLTTAEISSTVVTLTGSTSVELNGNTNFAVKYTELKAAFDQLKTDFNNLVTAYNSHIHVTTATIGASAVPGVISPTVSSGTPSTADMSTAKNDIVLM